jgi:hypothetical protein
LKGVYLIKQNIDQQFNFKGRNTTLGVYAVLTNDPLQVNIMFSEMFLNFLSTQVLENLYNNNEEFFNPKPKHSANTILTQAKVLYSKMLTLVELFPQVIITK